MTPNLSKHQVRRICALIASVAAFAIWTFSSFAPPPLNSNFFQQLFSAAPSQPQPITPTSPHSPSASNGGRAVDALAQLEVRPKYYGQKYYRKLFYKDWGILNGCKTRDSILKRDLEDTRLSACKVLSGRLSDPYTGKVIHFMRGPHSSAAIQIDHVVALSNAWATGAFQLNSAQRYALSQDPLNLLAVDGAANQQKSDADASDWLPSNRDFRCEYVARQISVKRKYQLWVTPREKNSMLQVLSSCPDQAVLSRK